MNYTVLITDTRTGETRKDKNNLAGAASQIDINDEKVWDDEATANIAMAISNWRKERADWVP